MPLVEALLEAGHELQLVMRPPAAELAADLFSEVAVLLLEDDPYRAETRKRWLPFRREIKAIEEFQPDLYVASAFAQNFFDEVFVRRNRGKVSTIGFGAEAGEDTGGTLPMVSGFTQIVRVPTDLPEFQKNLVMAETILGRTVTRTQPRQATPASFDEARALLHAHGFAPHRYTVVCAGGRPGTAMKEWGENNWRTLLGEISDAENFPFVFVGNPKEAASIERLRAALPATATSINLATDPPPVGVSYALVSMAAAYLGRDSGVMHLAAASDRPLLALFGGGHWPRFLPEASRGIVLNRMTSCRGCCFECPFPEPYCVRDIPVASVADAWRRLSAINTLDIVELPEKAETANLHRARPFAAN